MTGTGRLSAHIPIEIEERSDMCAAYTNARLHAPCSEQAYCSWRFNPTSWEITIQSHLTNANTTHAQKHLLCCWHVGTWPAHPHHTIAHQPLRHTLTYIALPRQPQTRPKDRRGEHAQGLSIGCNCKRAFASGRTRSQRISLR